MAWDIQINPHAEATSVSRELVDVLDEFVQDFEVRYCGLQPDSNVIAALRRVQAHTREEEAAIAYIVRELERGDAVELLIGH